MCAIAAGNEFFTIGYVPAITGGARCRAATGRHAVTATVCARSECASGDGAKRREHRRAQNPPRTRDNRDNGPVERSIETQVSQAVDAWLRWLPRWEPATHRGRIAPCRRCFGSPVLSAAGLGADVPHGVQHGLSTRIKTIVDHAVADYTSRNLPMLQAELDQQAARNRARSYRPAEGLDPEFEGLPLDPDPVPGAPFLFTIGGLAEEADADIPALPPLSDDAKAALRQEVGLADDYANMVGREVCAVLLHHRLRIQAAIAQYVEPQIAAMLEELTRSLDAPFEPNADPGPPEL